MVAESLSKVISSVAFASRNRFTGFESLKLAMSPQVGPLRSIFGGVVTLHRITGDLHLKSLGISETTRKLFVRSSFQHQLPRS